MLPVWVESVSHTDTVGTDESVCSCSLVAIRTFDTAPCYHTCLSACQAFCINVRKQSSHRNDKRCPALVGLYCFQPVLSGKHFPCKLSASCRTGIVIGVNRPSLQMCWCPALIVLSVNASCVDAPLLGNNCRDSRLPVFRLQPVVSQLLSGTPDEKHPRRLVFRE